MVRSYLGPMFAIGIVTLGACTYNQYEGEDTEEFRESVLACEEAVKRIRNCCVPAARFRCHYSKTYPRGCDGERTSDVLTVVQPDLKRANQRALEEMSCEEIASSGYCEAG